MKIIRHPIFQRFFAFTMVLNIVLSAPNPKSMDLAPEVPFFFFKCPVFGFTLHWAKSERCEIILFGGRILPN